MSQFKQLFKGSAPTSAPGSPSTPGKEGRFRKFRKFNSKTTSGLMSETNLLKQKSVSTSALTQLEDESNDDTFGKNRRRSSFEPNTSFESLPQNQITVKELIEKLITHLQVLERKNEILTQTIQQLTEEKTSLETELSSTKVELNLFKNRLNQIEEIANEWHCSICMDNKTTIIKSKRLIVATYCGHIFCSLCAQSLTNSSRQSKHCPTCRKPLKDGQYSYHPIFL